MAWSRRCCASRCCRSATRRAASRARCVSRTRLSAVSISVMEAPKVTEQPWLALSSGSLHAPIATVEYLSTSATGQCKSLAKKRAVFACFSAGWEVHRRCPEVVGVFDYAQATAADFYKRLKVPKHFEMFKDADG